PCNASYTRSRHSSISPHSPSTLFPYTTLFRSLLELLKKLQIARTHFVGLSMGGMIGQTVALKERALFERLVLADTGHAQTPETIDRKSTRLNSSHEWISYAVFCLKKKKRARTL